MTVRDLFSEDGLQETIARVEGLNESTQPQWGKMKVGQMMAHCSVAYDMALTGKYPVSGKFKTWLISMLAKKQVVGPKPYPKNGRTAPEFMITDERTFSTEKARLLENLKATHKLGRDHFEGKQSISFGKLSSDEWNMVFSKHLDHHLTQFGV